MDKSDYQDYKTFVYGRTRSWSLIGSTLNGVSSIFLIIFVPASQWVFLLTIVPYVLDFTLIATYPKYMNQHTPNETSFLKEMGKGFKETIGALKDIRLRKGIFSSSSYDAVYKGLKDYIQPIMIFYIAAVTASLGFSSSRINLSEDNFIKIILGSVYSVFYLVSAVSSMNAYRIKNLIGNAKRAMDILFYLFASILLLCAIFIWTNLAVVVIFLYLLIYIFQNIRRPLSVDYLGDTMKKEQRATMLSVEAQIKSMLVFVFAPLFGLIADFSIPALFIGIALIMLIVNFFLLKGDIVIPSVKKKETSTNAILSDEQL